MKKIFDLIIGNKIKTYFSLAVVVAFGVFISAKVVKYNNALKAVARLKIERDNLFIEKEEYKAYNATLEAQKDSLGKVMTEDKVNYARVIQETQGVIQQQRVLIKGKDKHIGNLESGLMCKVPQKVKIGFLRYETRLVVVNCDSLEKTL